MRGGVLMNNRFWVKAIGIATVIIGAGLSLVDDWVNDKNMDEKIEVKIREALAEREIGES
jgi:hypothetical protein